LKEVIVFIVTLLGKGSIQNYEMTLLGKGSIQNYANSQIGRSSVEAARELVDDTFRKSPNRALHDWTQSTAFDLGFNPKTSCRQLKGRVQVPAAALIQLSETLIHHGGY
jgi:hypothetical protein